MGYGITTSPQRGRKRVAMNTDPIVTDHHRALAESLARAVDRPGQDIDRIARKIAEDEANEQEAPRAPTSALDNIKRLTESGKRVYWKSTAYRVVKDRLGQWLIECCVNGSCIGLTWSDGVTLNGDPEDFFTIN